ncbi:3-deoxy-D-manno-octulosonic acid transferase [Bacteroidia bacterium]|nr:3-deoxy-D-manno-octulosonic acid transferase [Bacteroidia bacterium]GHU82011.1 3-deoxy-D-manno-octulosonic acid transferase [Bacteroidia bacterium]GHV71261.1 3-deoxy-D-manno-octulosonic acid transferase [Bacteroidia bacterium]
MMYNIAIALYSFAVRLVSPFNKKAKKILAGQKETFSILKKEIDPKAKYIWFHAASLGEFEQGRPLIEKIRLEKPEYRILLSFFSPSGYEVRKDYPGADIVCYLPFDYNKHAKKFLDLAKPEMAVFIKYEFWMNYLNQLKHNNIPTYIISAIFRKNQIFFRWYGRKYRNVLSNFNWFFVQDNNSLELLKRFNYRNVTVSGDTRFDRVQEIAEKRKDIPAIEKFLNKTEENKRFVLVAGSSWEKDEDILIPYFNQNPDIKLIIAPHEIGEKRIETLINRLSRPFARLSSTNDTEIEKADCLIIDCIGLLSSVYRYGDIAYVGGGFGVGIHNILEAAVYGIPVVFGPNYQKFKEARELIACHGAFTVANGDELAIHLNERFIYDHLLRENGKSAKDYVIHNLGATHKIYEKIF